MKESVRTVFQILKSHPISLTVGGLFVLTAAGELFLEHTIFYCPCDEGTAWWYSSAFIAGPAVLLFCFSMLVNTFMWERCYGCYGPKNTGEQDCYFKFKVIIQSLLLPCFWLANAFLDGDYIACALAENPCRAGNIAVEYEPLCVEASRQSECVKWKTEEYKMIAARCQIWTWLAVSVVVAVGSFVFCCCRCREKNSYYEFQLSSAYKGVNSIAAEEIMQGLAKKELSKTVEKDLQELKILPEPASRGLPV